MPSEQCLLNFPSVQQGFPGAFPGLPLSAYAWVIAPNPRCFTPAPSLQNWCPFVNFTGIVRLGNRSPNPELSKKHSEEGSLVP
ncbi:hypothetical protein NPIL_262441 [Nephila pilipes]|uniref:Uncharacterized protein n=1 Tax=Nephila pilipes TaxID=299642 RepID=A0A8X6UAY0_NEPPI|nr:hypothetical protein NPIL_262441 [Nephila pilipes]